MSQPQDSTLQNSPKPTPHSEAEKLADEFATLATKVVLKADAGIDILAGLQQKPVKR